MVDINDLFFSLVNANYQGLHVYWTDQNHRVLGCNKTQAQYLGFHDPNELRDKTLMEIGELLGQDKDQIQRIQENNLNIMQTLQPSIVEEQYDIFEKKTLFLSYKAPFFDLKGELKGIIGISTDINARQELENKLNSLRLSSDRYLESILLSSPNNIYWVDRNSKVIGCNDQQAKYCGLTHRTDLIGKDTDEIGVIMGWPKQLTEQIRQNDLWVMENRKPLITEEKVLMDGVESYFLASKSPMFDDQNNVIGMMGIATNITSQKLIERELEKARKKAEASNRAKTRFISNISHDIRTPLIGIHGVARWLKEKIADPYRDEVQAMISASQELLLLLNNVINLSKLEDDASAKNKREIFDLHSLINRLIDLFTPVAKQKNLILNLEYSNSIPKKFISNPMLIQRSILNLISNALKFTEQGRVTVRVIENTSVPKSEKLPIQIIVEDTGIGIPAEVQREIFDKFYKVTPSFQGKYRGNGLGLSLVERFIDKLGGNISVTSEVGKGSQFSINLRLESTQKNIRPKVDHLDEYVQDHVESVQHQMVQELEAHYALSPMPEFEPAKRVLVVEDSYLIQKGIAHILSKLHCHVDFAANGARALELAKFRQYDLIFMDIGLPDHDGLWVSHKIRQLPPPLGITVIIGLTASMEPNLNESYLAAGMNDVILKPLTTDVAHRYLNKIKVLP